MASCLVITGYREQVRYRIEYCTYGTLVDKLARLPRITKGSIEQTLLFIKYLPF